MDFIYLCVPCRAFIEVLQNPLDFFFRVYTSQRTEHYRNARCTSSCFSCYLSRLLPITANSLQHGSNRLRALLPVDCTIEISRSSNTRRPQMSPQPHRYPSLGGPVWPEGNSDLVCKQPDCSPALRLQHLHCASFFPKISMQ